MAGLGDCFVSGGHNHDPSRHCRWNLALLPQQAVSISFGAFKHSLFGMEALAYDSRAGLRVNHLYLDLKRDVQHESDAMEP